ncbi:MAG TPA: tetratricopeptide repeat protein [Spirochaetota bacterium]|nr:tetratricopeptide repeat protein [Spirochaetota bacterium]
MRSKTAIIILLGLALCGTGAPAQTKGKEKAGDDGFKKATAYFYERKFEMAEILLQEELRKNPENRLAYSYLGDIFLYKKRLDGAMELYKKALELDPKGAEEYFRLGQIHYYKKEAFPAIQNFERAYALDSKIKFSHYHIGLTHLMLERDKLRTIASWEKYLSIAPEDPQYEKIRRAIELLKDPNFVLPPVGSDVSIEEALHLGGAVLRETDRKAEDKKAGHEGKKTKSKLEDIYRDDGL